MKYPRTPGHKVPGTSAEAAAAVQPEDKRLRQQCLRLLQRVDSTPDEAAAFLGRTVLAIRPRFSQLKTLGLIVDTGERRRNSSGRRAAVWRAI